MRMNKFFLVCFSLILISASCEKEGGFDPDPIDERDPAEQALIDDDSLVSFLETHFYNYEEFANPPAGFDYKIEIDTISGENAGKTPIIESPLLETKTIIKDDVEYTIYYLKVREGQGEPATFTDSTFVTYRGGLLSGDMFDSAATPTWLDMVYSVEGFSEGVTEFQGATGFEINPDNTVQWNDDFGIGAVFFPSGLGYFSEPPAESIIPRYSPLVFTFELYGVNDTDHDQDGIPTVMEDLDGDEILAMDLDDDTDADLTPNFEDDDDDDDGILTRDEIIINEDGTLTFPDTDGDGVPDYLDAE